jgi:hypothetical protein
MLSADPPRTRGDVNMCSTSFTPPSRATTDEVGIGSTTIEKTLLQSLKLVERSIFVDRPLLLKGSRRLWSRSGARGRRRVRRLGGSGYRVWARRGLLPMSLFKGTVLMTRDRACFVLQEIKNT